METAYEQNNGSQLVVLEENQLVCQLTNRVVKATDKELTLQCMSSHLKTWSATSEWSMKTLTLAR